MAKYKKKSAAAVVAVTTRSIDSREREAQEYISRFTKLASRIHPNSEFLTHVLSATHLAYTDRMRALVESDLQVVAKVGEKHLLRVWRDGDRYNTTFLEHFDSTEGEHYQCLCTEGFDNPHDAAKSFLTRAESDKPWMWTN